MKTSPPLLLRGPNFSPRPVHYFLSPCRIQCFLLTSFLDDNIKRLRQRLKRHPAPWQRGAASDLLSSLFSSGCSLLPLLLLTFTSAGTRVFVGFPICVQTLIFMIHIKLSQIKSSLNHVLANKNMMDVFSPSLQLQTTSTSSLFLNLLFLPPSSSPLSPSAGGFLVLSQKKISFVTWLKWQTKIPSPSCSTDPLLPEQPGGRGRRQRGGGGAPPGRLQSLTFRPCFVFLVFSFVDPEPRLTVAPRDLPAMRGKRHDKRLCYHSGC